MEEDPPPGVPEWIVTYGDMMSLLLTFFIMLVSLSEIAAEQKYMQMVEALDKYLGYDTAPLQPPGDSHPANSPVLKSDDVKPGGGTESDGTGGVRTKAMEGRDTRVRVTEEGRPEQIGESILFQGNQKLTAESEAGLLAISRKLKGKPNKIEIRTYTSRESTTPDSTYESRMQLAYERAHIVLALFTEWGIEPERIRIMASPAGDSTDGVVPGAVSAERVEIFTTDMLTSSYVAPRTH